MTKNGRWYVEVEMADGMAFSVIRGPVIHGRDGVIADTMNCDHCWTIEDQCKHADLMAEAPAMRQWIERVLPHIDPAYIGQAAIDEGREILGRIDHRKSVP